MLFPLAISGTVLYVKSLAISRFKSFRHAGLEFSRGFTCVVGPNGSGKSNICDALLFGLGESSLRRLRANKLEDLITLQKHKSNMAKATVTIELGGDANMELVRKVRADGKTAYRLNGKHVTRKDAISVLEAHGLYVDERNTITQGEISNLTELNPRQRRELIDAAAGIKEFDEKKAESMRELDKVNAKISEARAILHERLEFIKELQKEKEAAEKYAAAALRIKSLNYSILLGRQELAKVAYEGYSKDLAEVSEKKKAAEQKISEISKRIDELNAERQQLTDKLSKSSKSNEEITSKLEKINMDIASCSAQVETYENNMENSKRQEEIIKKEIEEIKAHIQVNESELGKIAGEIKSSDKELEKLSEGSSEEIRTAVEIKEYEDKISYLDKASIEAAEKISRLRSDILQHNSKKESIEKELAELQNSIDKSNQSLAYSRKSIDDKKKAIESIKKAVDEFQTAYVSEEQRIGELESRILALKEKRALSGRREAPARELVAKEFGIKSGYYGTVSELFTYDEKYSVAIDAACGGRLNYFVVDTIETANKIIEFLKRNKLGIGTFMPLREMNARVPHDSGPSSGLVPLLSVVKFDSKFSKIFNYVLANTYLAESILEAKSKGIGDRRYVTLSGELVETSGIVSGGYRHKDLSAASIESELKSKTAELAELRKESAALQDRLFESRKNLAAHEAEVKVLENSVPEIESAIKGYASRIEELSGQHTVESLAAGKLSAEEKLLVESSKKTNSELSELKAKYQKLVSDTLKESAAMAKYKMSSKELREANALKEKIQSLRVREAELSKENSMLSEKEKELSAEGDGQTAAYKNSSRMLSELKKKMSALDAEKARIDDEAKSGNKETKSAYERIDSINEEIVKLSAEKGKEESSADNYSRQSNDIEVKKGQLDVRITDINAELSAYDKDKVEVINGSLEDMEKEVYSLNQRIGELGTVNMKAPEIYAQKSKDVEEANEKVITLDTEQRAVVEMMNEIETKKLNAFMSVFKEVNTNFTRLYSSIFTDQQAQLVLDDEKNPAESGLEIEIRKEGKAIRFAGRSGGERSLTFLMLLFAIHQCRPSSLYVFDEIDAALDKENSKKLSLLIKQLSANSQFVVVSHNDSLIVNADAAVGVIKKDDESNVVGVEISTVKNR